MEAVTIAQTPGELYNSILIDTPLAEFFNGFSEADLDEMNIEIIRNTLFKVNTSNINYWNYDISVTSILRIFCVINLVIYKCTVCFGQADKTGKTYAFFSENPKKR